MDVSYNISFAHQEGYGFWYSLVGILMLLFLGVYDEHEVESKAIPITACGL
jgi:hypothetical protein